MSKFADALAAGYTKQEIVSFLRDKPGYGERIDAALSDGYSEDEIADFLHKREFAEINPSASEVDLDYLAKDSIKSARKPKVTREEDYQQRVENYQKAGSGRLGAEQAATFDVNLEDKFQSRHSDIRTPVRGDINAMASEQNQQWRDAETTLRQDAGRDRTFGEATKDVGAQLLEGGQNIAGAIPDMVAPDSEWANFHRKAADFWRSKQSEPIKARMELSSRAIDKAGEDGVIAQVVEAASQYWDDPALASRFVVTNLPSMLPGIGAVKLAQAAALARGATAAKAMTAGTVAAAGTNAALNAGGARGEAFEDIKNTLMRQGMDEQEATSIAIRESMLPGFVGGVTGAISGGSGLERVIAGGVGKPIRSALAELAGEQVEEVTPKLATNLMAGQHDDRPVSQDVGRTMVETAIGSGPGAVLAGGMSALEGRQQPDPIGGQQPDITMPEAQPIQGTPNAAGVVTQPVPAQPPIQSAPVPTGSFAQMDEFAVFMQQEQADIAQRRERLSGVQAERQLPVLQQRMESDLETMDARVSDARQRTAAESRLADLEAAMQSPNPMATFAELRTSKNQPVLPEDAAIIKRRMGQAEAFQQDLPPATEPSLPDEGMSQLVPELAAAPAEAVTGTTQHIAQIKLVNDALAAGYKLQGRALVHPKTGKKINLNRVQREHLARIKRGAANGTDGGGLEVDDGGSRDGQGNQPGGSKGLVPGLDDQPGPADTGTPGGGQQPAAPVADAGGTDVPRLKIGKTPNSAEPVTVRDGVIYIGDYPAQNYETGEDVTTTDTSQAGIKRALSDAGAMPNGIRLFAEKAEQVLPAPLPETGAPGTATTAQTQQGEDAPQQGAMVKKPRLTVEFNGEVFDVESIQDAADKWNRFVETSMGGVSQVGNGVTIKEDGKPIARVSYNGRIWDMDENEIVFDQKKKAPTQQDTRAKLKAEVEKAKAEPETGTGTGTRTKRKQRPSNNLIQRIKQLGGINIKYLSDVTGERTTKGLPVGLFQYMRRKGTVITNGHGLDTLATELAADGFPINIDDDTDNGGVNQLTELIRSAISGRPVLNYAGQEDAIMQDAARQEREILFEKADELGVNAPRSIKTEVLRARIDAEIAKLEKEVSDAGEAVADDYDDIPFTQEELSAAKTGSEDDLFGDLYDGQETEAGSEAQAGAVAEGRTPEGAATDRAQEGPEETDAQEGFSLTAPSAEELKAAEKESARKAKEEADKIKADEMRGDFALTGSDRETDKAAAQGAQELFGLPRNAKEAGAQVASGVASARKGLSESDAAMAEVESVIRSFAGKNTVEFAEAMTRWASRGNDQLLQAYVDRIGFDMDRMLANGATQATVRNVMYAELHKEAKRLASLETKPATSMETPAAQRKATIEERIASEKASHVLDLNKAQTGWKRIDDANNEAVTLVSYDGKIAVPFLTKDKKSGAASVRMNAEAHAYAIDNPYRAAPIPEGELIANPLYGEAESTAGQPAATTAQPAQSKPASAQSTKPAVSANTVFTEDAAAAARARLKAKLGRLNTGLDPETMLDGITLAGYHIEKGARTFAAYAKAMVEDLGDAVKPYLKSWYAAVSMDPRASGFDGLDDLATVQSAYLDAILKETGDTNEPDQRSSTDLERNRQDSGTQYGMGEEGVRNDGRSDGGTGEQGIRQSDQDGAGQRSERVSGREASTTGAQGDFSPFAEKPGTEERASGSDDGSGSGSLGFDGPTIEPEGTSQTDAVAQGGLGLDLKRIAQAKAENIEVRPGDRENIAETLPFLMQGQQDDVAFAENRFAKPNGYGVLFTNGTGTGKTASGLGIVKRFARQGKTNTLIVVPSDKIASDWIAFGKNLKLDIAMLADTNDAGQGIVITTYANFGANDALVRRKWDLVVTDESHYLMQAKDGKNTLAIDKLRAITMHPRGEYARYAAMYRAEIDEEHRLREKVRSNNKVINLDDTTFEQAEQLRQANKKNEDRIDELSKFLARKRAEVRDEVDAAQGKARPRVVFLSATPFAYEKTVDYAEGYLFDYPEVKDGRGGYNSGSGFDRFMMQHFGYRMRYNKLTEPGPEVNRGLMQRAFNSWLKSEKVLSGRMLDVEHDYDRKFILVDSAIGAELDRAMQWIWDRANDGNNPNKEGYSALQSALSDKFDHLTRRYLLEAIKAKEAIPIIRRHLDLGRKVVVFHDFKKGGGFNPVRFGRANENADAAEGVKNAQAYNAAVDAFNSEFSGLIESPMWATASPIDALSQAFPDALLFNGDVPAKKRRDNVALFQDDNSGRNLIIGQAAAMKEGVSLHDTTGKHQRVLINLGLPTQPTTSIQQEGRIFRVGQASNAMFRYLNTGTNWERFAFATSIAQRASAAENLAVGEEARALMDAFIEGFEESDTYAPGHEGEGTGGKARDKAANQALTEWDRAMTMYWAQAKKNSRTKALEGVDYFATPEPLGLKMVEWADIRDGDKALEPSAGHGAIARWLPDNISRTVVEPSSELASRLKMVVGDARLLQERFEDLDTKANKYDAIVMNPPFGSGGSTAIQHVAKAAKHLNNGGRIVALIPTGPAADAKFGKWLYGEEQRPAKPLGTIPGSDKQYFVGDTVSLIDGSQYSIEGNGSAGVMLRPLAGGIPEGWRSHYFQEVTPGPRTESVKLAPNLYLRADIKLPQVTFERAGTSVAARVVVIEKQTDKDAAAKIQQVNRDYSDAENIKDFFERIKDSSIPARAMPETASPSTPGNPATEGKKLETDAEEITYTTKKGKVLHGVIAKGITEAQAKEYDPYTWKKDGGFFIRMEHVKRPGETAKFSRAQPQVADPHTIKSFKTAIDAAEGNGFADKLEATGNVAFITSEELPETLNALDGMATENMPVSYRAAGAQYAQEMGTPWIDRTNRTRFSKAREPLRRGEVLPKTDREKQVELAMDALRSEQGAAYTRRVDRAVAKYTKHIRDAVGLDLDHDAVRALARSMMAAEKSPDETYRAEEKAINERLTVLEAERQSLISKRLGPPEFEGIQQLRDFPRAVVNTEAFRAWFRNSKVVDKDGNPLIALHGTRYDITSFQTVQRITSKRLTNANWFGQLGSWFAAPSQGADYENGSAEATAEVFATLRGDSGAAIYPAFLSIQNPAEFADYTELVEARGAAGGGEKLRRQLIAAGYDGVVVRDSDTDGGQYRDDWVAFHPYQIKSAIGNDGTFDPTNPDIRYSKDGRILAFYKDGKVHFVTDNISQTKDSVPGLLRHEIAVHALRLNRSDKEFQAILRELRLMRDSGNVKVKAAYAAVPKDTPASLVDEEALGYLTEKNPEQSMAKRFIAWLRNVLRKLAGDWANTMTVDDLVWMAGKALRTAPERMAGTGDGMAMSRREKAPWYYSALAKAVDAMPAKVDGTSAMNVKAWLLANADKQGVKRDEIQWSGITDYLDLRGKNKVTKAEIADYLSGNGVTVQDVVKADDPMPDMTPLSEHEIAEYEDMRSRIRANPTRNVLSNNERLRFNDLARRYSQVESYPKARKHTKFSGYWESSYKGGIPGTYREILVTLPELEGPVPDGWVVKEGKADGRVPALMYHAVKQDGPAANKPLSEIEGRFIFYSAETRKELYRRIRTRNGTEYPGLSVNPANFNSPHWDEPNVLVHVRLDEVFGADGKRYVRVGEVQSDWGQKGKKEGFARPNDAALLAEQKELRNRKDGITAKWGGLHGLLVATKTDPVAAAEKAEKDAIDVRLREIEEALGNIPMAGAIRGAAPPSAPFVTDTKAWVALGIKRAIMHAIDVGADGVVFGTGRQNADLYDLSKQVDRVRITPTGGVWSVTAWKDGNQVLSKDASDESELAEFVGKELAEKAVNEKGGDYSGLDLQVGGSGMRAFYDKIVPSVANEVLRKIGVEKAVSIETEGGKQPGFTIPDAMREKIDNEGLPLFSKTIKSDIGNIIENPTRDQAENLLRRARYGAMRGLRDPETGKLYIWDAADAIHHQAAREIGITDDVYERLEFGDVDTLPRGVFSGEPGYGRVIADRASAYDVVMYSRRLDDTAPSGPVWDAPVKSTGWENIVYELQDKHIDTKRVVEAIKKSGEYIDPEWNPHLQEQLFHGRSAKGVDDFLNDELRPLVEAMAKAGVNQEDLNAYLHARHAKERNEAMKAINEDREDNDGLSGLTDEEADAVLESFSDRADTMEDLANHVDRMIAGTRRMLVGYGLETQETISGWAEKYEHYVPLHREGFPQTPGTGQGYSIRGKFSKLATGSHLPVDNILAHVAMQRERAIVRGEKNRVSMALYSLALLNPNKAFWSVDKVAEEVVTDPDTGLPIVMAGDIGDIKVPRIKAIDKATGQVTYYPDPTYKGRGNVVVARINGKDYAVIFNERNERAMRMAESLKNLDIDQMHDWLGKFGAVTRYFAAINTQYNPVFGLWNLMRDVSMAALNLSSTPIANKRLEVMSDTSKALAGIYQDARAVRKGKKPSSAWADLWEQFQQDGGPTGYRDLFRTSKDRADAIQHMLDPEWWQKTWPGKVVTAGGLLAVPEKVLVDKVGRAMFDWLSDFNLTMENAIRLAAYKVALDDGMDRQEAAALAKNLTVNFNKKGRSSTSLGALFAFFNASVQGTARIAETIYKDGKMTEAGQVIVLGGITMGAMQALALALAGFDEDEPPEWIKERSLVIPVPGTEKGYVAYPYPLGYHVLPNIGRHLMEYMLSGFEDPGKRVVNLVVTAMNAFNPLGSATVAQMATPTVFDPLVALAENQDFTGKPIYREDISSLRPTPGESRAKDSATVIGRGVAIAANRLTGGTKYTPGWFSPTPDQIDYLLGQLTGGVGREAGKLEQTVTGLVTGDLAPMYKVPILGRMAGSASSEFAQRDRFYRNLTELNTLQAELQGRREERQNTIEFRREHPELRMLGDAAEIQAQMRVYKKSGKRYDERLAKRINRFNEKYAELQSSN